MIAGRPIKVTWNAVYKDFRQHFPNLKKRVVHWHPHDYLTIKIFIDDGMVLTYDYFTKSPIVLKENWKEEGIK